jgi:hypothetical protein
MADAAECLIRNIKLYKESFNNFDPVLTTYPLTSYQYWIQYVNCCGVTSRIRIDNQAGWNSSGDPIIYEYGISPGLPALFPPFIFVKNISDGTEIILPGWNNTDDGWVETVDGTSYIDSCSTTSTTTIAPTPTTTKAPLSIVFNSCCDDNATYSTGLYPGFPRVICLKDPIQSVYILGSGTSSTLLGAASYSQFFLNEEVTNPGPSCSCSCATQSLDCLKIRVRSTEAGTFRYTECESGIVIDQDLTPYNFQSVERPTLLSVPQNCTYSIGNTATPVIFTRTVGTIVPSNPATNSSLITYTGPFAELMVNSYYEVPVSGTYFVTSLILGNLTTKGGATNSVEGRIRKDSGGITSSLDSSSFQIYYSNAANVYNYTYSIQLGGKTYSLLAGDKLFIDISKSQDTTQAEYRSISCDIYPGVTVYATSSTGFIKTLYKEPWSPYPAVFNPFKIVLAHPYITGTAGWSGTTYGIPVTTGYTFSWMIEGTFSLTYHNIKTFCLGLGLVKQLDSAYNNVFSTLCYENLPIQPTSGGTIVRAFTFSTSTYRRIFNKNDVLSLETQGWVSSLRNIQTIFNATFSMSIKNGSYLSVNPEPWWQNARNFTYFEVSGGPTHAGDALNYDFDFCARSPLQNAPPLQRISGSYTYSVCSTPGSLYYTSCSTPLSFTCGSYVREFVEISGTQCLWPTTTSTTTVSGGGGGGSP